MPFNPATGQWVPDDVSPYEPPLQPPPPDDSWMTPPPPWANPIVPPEVLPKAEGAEEGAAAQGTPWQDSMAGVSSAIDAQSPYGAVPEQVMNQDRLNALRQQEWQAMQQFPQLGGGGPRPTPWSY